MQSVTFAFWSLHVPLCLWGPAFLVWYLLQKLVHYFILFLNNQYELTTLSPFLAKPICMFIWNIATSRQMFLREVFSRSAVNVCTTTWLKLDDKESISSLKERPAGLPWLSFTVKSICDGVSNECTRVWMSCSAGSSDSAYSSWWIKNNGRTGCWTERELLGEVVWKCIHLTGLKEFNSDWRESQSRDMSSWDSTSRLGPKMTTLAPQLVTGEKMNTSQSKPRNWWANNGAVDDVGELQ